MGEVVFKKKNSKDTVDTNAISVMEQAINKYKQTHKTKMSNEQNNKQMEKQLDKVEECMIRAVQNLRDATGACGLEIPVPYHLEKAKLEAKYALKRFRIFRNRMEM